MESRESKTSECPICGRSFDISTINQHVNDCLNDGDDACVITQPNKKRKSTEMNPNAAWGCLKASSSAGENESRVSPENVKRHKTLQKSSTQRKPASPILVDEDSSSNESKGELQNQTKTFLSNTSNFQNRQKTFFSTSNKSDDNNVSSHPSKSQNPFFQKKTNSSVKSAKSEFSPLAEQMRPLTLENYVGQDKAVGEKSLLHSLLRSDHIPSMILWGPPGCGKTTLARIIAARCKNEGSAKFVQLSATTSGVNDVKEVIKVAKNDQKLLRRKTMLFLDEIHRFNKSQQDTLLPHVEDGTINLIGATTENPSFQVNSALLSRCRVIVLEKLSADALKMIITRALSELGAKIYETPDDIENNTASNSLEPVVWVEEQAIGVLANLCDGDARAALNSLQMAVESRIAALKNSSSKQKNTQKNGFDNVAMVTTEHIKDGLQRSHVLYDKTGEEHYNIVSALHKSIRGSDASASLYWLARMLEGGENPLYVSRRLVRCASEDIGLADPLALNQAVAAYQACHLIGMPECEVILAQCVVYMARAPKSVEIYEAYNKAKRKIKEHDGPLPGVPLHLRNAPTKLMKNLGYGKGYKYNPAFKNPVEQDYFPEELIGTDFFK
ncbi:ATPase WRNIP1 [Patella vulgata]|uniref:ATPase WRNIP1 n=1 Tax=Patella vulgata TaxID=6465 RepID=UPI0021803102|nr:ATPase WRNIP1 [Patella vulgata]